MRPKIATFPDDNVVRIIKWIDEFCLPHKGTESASVVVQLQELSEDEAERLRMRVDLANQNVLEGGEGHRNPRLICRHVLAPMLAILRIGDLYRGQSYVGMARMHIGTWAMPRAKQGQEDEVLSTPIQAPPGWKSTFFPLNRCEYAMNFARFRRSWVVHFHDCGTTVIIPATVVFQFFYGRTTDLVRAFTTGPWSWTMDQVIYPKQMESGLVTRETLDPHEWHIILQTSVQSQLAVLLAILRFGYGRRCAEAIHTHALARQSHALSPAAQGMPQPTERLAIVTAGAACGRAVASSQTIADQDEQPTHRSWCMRAKIPFEPDGDPLRMRLRGWYLRDRLGVIHGVQQQRFFATQILGCSVPTSLPPIGWERFNSGNHGKVRVPIDGPAPYGGDLDPEEASSDMLVVDDEDANADRTPRATDAITGMWLNQPKSYLLEKASSKQYKERGGSPKHHDGEPATVSPGKLTHVRDAPPSLTTPEPPKRQQLRFDALLNAIEALRSSGAVTGYGAHPPPAEFGRGVPRYAQPCWGFLGREHRSNTDPPSKHWRIVGRKARLGGGYDLFSRVALTLWIDTPLGSAYWIEIETRPREKYEAVLITDPPENTDMAIRRIIDRIAELEGEHLRTELIPWSQRISSLGTLHAVRHYFQSEECLSVAYLRRVFQRTGLA